MKQFSKIMFLALGFGLSAAVLGLVNSRHREMNKKIGLLLCLFFLAINAVAQQASQLPDKPKPQPGSTKTWWLTNSVNVVSTFGLAYAMHTGAHACARNGELLTYTPQYPRQKAFQAFKIGLSADAGIAIISRFFGKRHSRIAKILPLFSAAAQAGATVPILMAGCT